MISAILLAVLLAIIALSVVRGPGGYQRLARAEGSERVAIYRRILLTQLVLYTVPPIAGLLILGRTGALFTLPRELWPAASLLNSGSPPTEIDASLTWFIVGVVLLAVLLGAGVTWRRTRRGKGPPRSIAHIAALLPRTRDEVILGAGISLAAGIGEEIFFRLLLPMLLAAFIDPVAAVVVAILLFGVGHCYQGWKGVATTTLGGVLLTAMYLLTGSLAVAMLFHVTIDLMALAIRPVIRGAWAVRAI